MSVIAGQQGVSFSKWVFFLAGLVGVFLLLPQYLFEEQFGRSFPPAITHPEFFYGFTGIAIAWQVAFLVMSRDPVRYRPLMFPSMLEKFSFAGAMVVLFFQERVPATMLLSAAFDGILGILFIIAWKVTPARQFGERDTSVSR